MLDETQYKTIVEHSPNMIWLCGKDTFCNYFNSTWLRFTGRTLDQELGNGWAEGLYPDDFNHFFEVYLDSIEKQVPFEVEYRLRRHDGVYRWINDRGLPYYDTMGEFCGYIGYCSDITDKIQGKFSETNQKDELTGIYCYSYFEELAKLEFEKAKRYNLDFCLVLIDINNFKKIIDSYGHPVGDCVLKEFANLMQQQIRNFDLLGRYRGDEFFIVFPHTTQAEAHQVLSRIRTNTLFNIQCNKNYIIELSFRYGISSYKEGDSLDDLIVRSEKTMYRMKAGL